MRTTLEDLYYGNITPNEQRMAPGSELKRAVVILSISVDTFNSKIFGTYAAASRAA